MLCLNMIVRNESARILRALDAAKPYITCFAILDTGSTDDTVKLIEDWGRENLVGGIVGRGTFVDFSQARNDALSLARSYVQRHYPDVRYFLLQDADMELVVPDGAFKVPSGEAHSMIQKAGNTSYHNVRLLSTRSTARYVGVTHEYLPADIAGCLKGPYFVDHADGANRADKYERDIKLLTDDLKRDPVNPRSLFYLGNSYRDAGNPRMAIATYERYLPLSNWPEEKWTAQTYIAGCYKDLGDEDRFVSGMLKAFSMRPTRSEPLYDLALHFRGKPDQQALAMLFIEKGITIPKPDDDILFVNDYVYSAGFRDEYAICGFYTEKRERAFHIINGLALDPSVPEVSRARARTNMVFYLPKLAEMAPSAKHIPFKVTAPDGFTAMNPCISNKPDGNLEMLVRTVNYRIDDHGRYMIGDRGCQDAPIVTRNFLHTLSQIGEVTDTVEVLWARPEPKFPLVIGLEDMRIFWHDGERRFIACVREQSDTGMPEQWVGVLRDGWATEASLGSDPDKCEKNWAPMIHKGDLHWVYRLDDIILPGVKREKLLCRLAVDNISGSSQWLSWRGGYVAVVHEAITHPGTGRRVYQHRFAFYDASLSFLRLSLPFVFQDVQIEFCAGLAFKPTDHNFLISYGVRDEAAWITDVSENDVAAMIFGAH